MAQIIPFALAQLYRLDTKENAIRERLPRILEFMDVTPSERTAAVNIALFRVRNHGHIAHAINQAVEFARYRELAHARVRLFDEPDGAA